ncbi:MAG: uracil-DNA glycosylase [bacterium]|nr:uracil-DNA glycosylase [bacterium]
MSDPAKTRAWDRLDREVSTCERCPRLIEHCREVARVRRRAYRDQVYWGMPVPGFGDRQARILMLGLAPAAHGANRTGRMFTGDRSGDFLYAALHRAKLANQAEARARDDGLTLRDVYISATCRCAPPANKPSRDEMSRCESYLDRELDLLDDLRVLFALGKIAWDAALRRAARTPGSELPRPLPKFGHGAEAEVVLRAEAAPLRLIGSYHPSQQNTQTGRLTPAMFDSVIRRAVRVAAE